MPNTDGFWSPQSLLPLQFSALESDELLSKCFILLLQLLHLLLNRLQYAPDFFQGETRGNMLLTIPVECLNSNHVASFCHSLVVWIANSSEPVLRLFSLEDFNTAQNFQSQLSGIVD